MVVVGLTLGRVSVTLTKLRSRRFFVYCATSWRILHRREKQHDGFLEASGHLPFFFTPPLSGFHCRMVGRAGIAPVHSDRFWVDSLRLPSIVLCRWCPADPEAQLQPSKCRATSLHAVLVPAEMQDYSSAG